MKYTAPKIVKPQIHDDVSICCDGVVGWTSVSTGWIYMQCKTCFQQCGVKDKWWRQRNE